MENLGFHMPMERVANKAKNFREAEEWDLRQAKQMTADERSRIARILKERVCGAAIP